MPRLSRILAASLMISMLLAGGCARSGNRPSQTVTREPWQRFEDLVHPAPAPDPIGLRVGQSIYLSAGAEELIHIDLDLTPKARIREVPPKELSQLAMTCVQPPEVIFNEGQPQTRAGPCSITLRTDGVVSFSGGQPIYLSQAVRQLGRPLAAKAAEAEEAEFRGYARDLVRRYVRQLVLEDLEVRAAEATLSPADRIMAQKLAERAAADAHAEDLPELKRLFLRRTFYDRQIASQVHVSPGDIRRAYFSDPENTEAGFLNPETQDRIRQKLEAGQFASLREQLQNSLEKDSPIHINEPLLAAAFGPGIDTAMIDR